ncbi:CD36 family-domain-containing protein [Pelagophyceae sp. CCMP2097]|nr:CD36 family-domain-containing protein [Pelagophyceae sp. CCMP2097]
MVHPDAVGLRRGSATYASWASSDGEDGSYYSVFYFDTVNAAAVTFQNAVPKVVERGPYAYKTAWQLSEIDFLRSGKDVEYWDVKTYTFDAARSCSGCTEDDEVTAPDSVVSTLAELVDSLSADALEARLARILVKVALCKGQAAGELTPYRTRSIRDLHWGRWGDETLAVVLDAISRLPASIKNATGFPKALAELNTHVPGFEVNGTSLADVKRRCGAKERIDAGKRHSGAGSLRYKRFEGSKYVRVCQNGSRAGDEAKQIESACEPQSPEWDLLDEAVGESLAKDAGWHLAYATRSASKVDGGQGVFVKALHYDGGRFGVFGNGRGFVKSLLKTARPRGRETMDVFIDSVFRKLRFLRTDKDGRILRNGIELQRYEIDRRLMRANRDTADFDQLTTPFGAFNLTRPGGLPLWATQPHFEESGEVLQRSVLGFEPSRDRHNTLLDVEPRTGLVFRAAERLQFNALLFDYKWPGIEGDAILEELVEVLFPAEGCVFSAPNWTLPGRRSGARRNELGRVSPVGYIDRGFVLQGKTASEVASQLKHADSLAKASFLAWLCAAAVCFALAALCLALHRVNDRRVKRFTESVESHPLAAEPILAEPLLVESA